jgi:hypothetical protein
MEGEMAVLLNQNGYAKMNELGVSAEIIGKLSKIGAKILITPTALRVVTVIGTTPQAFQYEIAHQVLMQASKTKNVKIKESIEHFLVKIVTGYGVNMKSVEVGIVAQEALPATPTPAPSKVTADPYLQAIVKHYPLTETQMKVTAPIPLADAEGLYRPVRGSSPGTIYHLIGVWPTMKMAARLKDSSVSLRVEGKPNPAQSKALKELGFDQKGDYWSSHSLKVANLTVVQRYVGCIIASLEGSIMPAPDMALLVGKGS